MFDFFYYNSTVYAVRLSNFFCLCQHGVLPVLLRMQLATSNELTLSEISQALTLMGYVYPPRGQGVNILTIDGGGTK